jgi:hypothetical protein
VGVIESLVGKSQPAQDDEENSSQNDRFHIFRSSAYTDRLRP